VVAPVKIFSYLSTSLKRVRVESASIEDGFKTERAFPRKNLVKAVKAVAGPDFSGGVFPLF
jgi:hypothetical protein